MLKMGYKSRRTSQAYCLMAGERSWHFGPSQLRNSEATGVLPMYIQPYEFFKEIYQDKKIILMTLFFTDFLKFLIFHFYFILESLFLGFLGGSYSKEPAYNAGDLGSIPGLGRSPGEGNGCPLQYSSQENSMDRGAAI